jgi:hypothetical protein
MDLLSPRLFHLLDLFLLLALVSIEVKAVELVQLSLLDFCALCS